MHLRILPLLLALSAHPVAAEETFEGIFDFYLGGIPAGEMDFAARWDAADFSARSEFRAVGLLKALYDGYYIVSAEGGRAAETFAPARFEADTAFGDSRQKVRVSYADARPATVEADPPFKPRDYQIDPAAQVGTLDPLSAALLLVRPAPPDQLCNRSAEIFDGRRRYRIELGPAEIGPDRIRCAGDYVRVAGFSPKQMAKRTRYAFTAIFREVSPGRAELVQVLGETGVGLAVINRRAAPID